MIDIFFNDDFDEHDNDAVARRLKQAVVIPIRIFRHEQACETIVLAQKQRVQHRYLRRRVYAVAADSE